MMEDDFEAVLKQGFLEEAAQLLADAERCFLSLETNPEDPGVIDQLFRLAHNLKGSGNAVGFLSLGHFTHKLESLLLKIKKKEQSIGPATISLLLACNDHLQGWVTALRNDLNADVDSAALTADLEAMLAGTVVSQEPASEPAPEVPSAAEFGIEAIDSPPGQGPLTGLPAMDPPTQPQAPEQRPTEVAGSADEPKASPAKGKASGESKSSAGGKGRDESIRVKLDKLEKLLNFVGEMVILQSVVSEQAQGSHNPHLKKAIQQLSKVTKEIQDLSMNLRMIPLKQLFQKMQRIVRDTSSGLGKKVNITMEGEETEVDKTVSELLGDPLVHMVRNAVDHGIETAEERRSSGKDEAGQIRLAAYHHSGRLVIEIKDDGKGLDPAKLRQKAIEKGIIRPKAVLSDQEAYQLIFAPGFSTKTEVTDLSGRGVGMDVVRTNIEALQGEIQIQSQVGGGTLFRVQLPLTLAIIDALVVRSGAGRFVVPLSQVHESVKIAAKDVHSTAGAGDLFSLRGENLPLLQLCQLLGVRQSEGESTDRVAIVVRGQNRSFAVAVDEIIGQAQVVIKQLGQEYSGTKGFNSSAILSDGRPALILELEDLCERQRGAGQNFQRSVA